MYYEINISLNGQHLFATAERSITNHIKMKRVYNLLKEKFPEEEGYQINVTYWEKVGKQININEI